MGKRHRRALHRAHGADYDDRFFTLLIAGVFVSVIFLLLVF